MFKNLFFHKGNRNIYKGGKESATPIKEAHKLPTQTEAKTIDTQDAMIRQLERKAKTNATTRFYMYGY
jgi:hypothetical protein